MTATTANTHIRQYAQIHSHDLLCDQLGTIKRSDFENDISGEETYRNIINMALVPRCNRFSNHSNQNG